MKKLLIHSQDTIIANPHVFSANEQYVLKVDNSETDLDHFINGALSKGELYEKIMDSDIIFIRLSLSINYLEYLGLRLAYHIRLTTKLGNKRFIPIIMVCEESYQLIGLTSTLPEILFTPGLYIMEDSRNEFDRYAKMFSEGKLKPVKDEKSFLDKIRIPAPANYTSRHSLANEWGILRWAEMGKNFSESLRTKLSEINTSNRTLYFKYLERKHLFALEKEGRQAFKKDSMRETLIIPYVKDVKIYYIDDEAKKGWGVLFQDGIFKQYTDQNSFAYFQDFEKGGDRLMQLASLEAKIEELIHKENYNVFIIDLRLFDADFKEGAVPTGFQIIERIKILNPGIQIVVFTASKKAENVQRAQELRTTGYIIKESPENVLTRDESWMQFMAFSKTIRVAAEYSFLANIYGKLQKIRSLDVYSTSTIAKEKDFHLAVTSKGGFLEKIFKLLNAKEPDLIGAAFLECFVMLEKFANLFYNEKVRELEGVIVMSNGSEHCHFNTNGNTFNTCIEFNRGNYSYQKTQDGRTPIAATFHQTTVSRSSKIPGCGTRGLVRLLAVLKYRFAHPDAQLEMIMEASYLRSNLAAHDTGEIDKTKKSIELKDIFFILDTCIEVFRKV
ncbi:response regulator [Pedobacter heparinus]|uniref:response regulator n=1 Tax=Pedobacter heparinus TaxID=984 RepID=UPI00292E1134|nr:response regulator [Pedobacter heparinus]